MAGAAADYEKQTYRRINMTREALLDSIGDAYVVSSPIASPRPRQPSSHGSPRPALNSRLPNRDAPEAITYASKLDEWGLAFLKDVLPLDPFMVIQPGFDPAKEHLYRQTHVWIGGVNTSTPAHFDLFHNFYVRPAVSVWSKRRDGDFFVA